MAYKHSGDDSEWSHGKLFLENLANKFMEAEYFFYRKDYINFFDICEIIFPDVNMFLSEDEKKLSRRKYEKSMKIITRMRNRVAMYNYMSHSPDGNGMRINYGDRHILFNFLCYLKTKAKDRGLITKLERDFIDKIRRQRQKTEEEKEDEEW